MRVELLRKTSLRDDRMCDQFSLFTTRHSVDEIRLLKESEGRKIVCFGADENSWFYISVLREANIGPDIITDNSRTSLDVYLDNIPLIQPTTLLKDKEKYYFIITLKNGVFVNQIRQQLLFCGVKDFAILTLNRLFDFDRASNKNLKSAYLKAFNEIYENVDFTEANYDSARTFFVGPIILWNRVAEWILTEYADRENISLLDVGPGTGIASLVFKELLNVSLNWINFDELLKFYEVSQQSMLIERNKINVQYGYIETDDFHGDYDIIIFTDVLEHLVYNPVNTLKKLGSMLKSDGHLALTTPMKMGKGLPYFGNWRDLPALNQDTVTRNAELLKISETHHVYEYSPEEVDEILAESGFKVVFTEIRNYPMGMNYICVKNKD